MGKLLKCHFKGKTCRKLANGQDIDYSEKKNGPSSSSAPILRLFSIIFKHVYWYYIQQISGERLQDHWSSGLCCLMPEAVFYVFKSNFDEENTPSIF